MTSSASMISMATRWGIVSSKSLPSVFGRQLGRVISWHGSAAMSSPCFPYDVDRAWLTKIGRRFIETLHSEIRAGGHSHEIGASIGVALIPDAGATAEEIIHNADLAMYRARGKIGRRSYSPNLPQVTRGKSLRHIARLTFSIVRQCLLWVISRHKSNDALRPLTAQDRTCRIDGGSVDQPSACRQV